MEYLKRGAEPMWQGLKDLWDYLSTRVKDSRDDAEYDRIEKVFGKWGWHMIVWYMFLVGLTFFGTYIIFHKVTLLYIACTVLGWIVVKSLFTKIFLD